MFAELFARSSFSFLRGASQPEEMVEEAKRLGLGALALCDRDGLYGAARAFRRAQELEQRFIVGAELTLEIEEDSARVDDGTRTNVRTTNAFAGARDEATRTLGLLVENHGGYRNLCELLTLAHAERPKGESGLSLAMLARRTSGLLALIPAPRDPEGPSRVPDSVLEAVREAFGSRAYFVMHRHFDGFDRRRAEWVSTNARKLGLSILASARPDYHVRERKLLLDVLHCIRTGITLDEAGPSLGGNAEAELRSESEMRRLFRDHEDWVDRAGEVAAGLCFGLGELRYRFPCELLPGESADDKLRRLTFEGLLRRYPEGAGSTVREQVEKELRIIAKLEVAPYFLSTWEIVEIARRRKILCQGRGSAANSAVCYALGITAVDPARSNLLFERFLSAERHEPPDIDIDFEHERREEVIQEIYERYGRDRAAMVSEVICYRGKSALRETGKVFGLSLDQVDRLSRTVTHWTELDGSGVSEKRLRELGLDPADRRLGLVLGAARRLQGFPRHLSIHVGGFVLSAEPLSQVAPIEPARMEGRTVIPWDKDDLETLGFFKVDVLGLGILTAIRKALGFVHANGGLRQSTVGSGVEAALAGVGQASAEEACAPLACMTCMPAKEAFDPLEVVTRIPAEDPAVYEMVQRADTVGVFQIESRAQMAMLPRLRPRYFYDLVVEVSIVRPGPIQGGMVHPYLKRRNGAEAVTYPHPELRQILERTLGVPLFQEQVMQLSMIGAGYTGGEADQLRRDMAAWKKSGRLLRHRDRLLRGFAEKGIDRAFGEALFEQIKGFGDYGFPESHAASFALLVYVSAWLKAHHPAEFGCALLNSQPMGFYSRSTIVQDMQRHGVEVRDVSIAQSFWESTLEAPARLHNARESGAQAGRSLAGSAVESGAQAARPFVGPAVRLGFHNLKGMSEAVARQIESARSERAFESVDDLVRRARLKRHSTEMLAESGALEAIVSGRRQALWQARAPRPEKLFEHVTVSEKWVPLPTLARAEQLVLDYERKGLSVTDHPLRHLRALLKRRRVMVASRLAEVKQGTLVKVAGLVLSRQQPGTASGVVFITLEDETGFSNLILYRHVFEKFHAVARHATLLLAKGKLERDTESGAHPVIHVIVRSLERLDTPRGAVAHRSRDFH